MKAETKRRFHFINVTDDKITNDNLFRVFRDFYNKVIGCCHDYYWRGEMPVSEEILTKSGLRTNH